MNSSSVSVSIIIVNYNSKELLKNCVDSIKEYIKDLNYAIIIVGNNLIDISVEFYKSIKSFFKFLDY